MQLRSQAIQRWWPTTQSLDLVEGPVQVAATAVQADVARFVKDEPLTTSWQAFPGSTLPLGLHPNARPNVLPRLAFPFAMDGALEQQLSMRRLRLAMLVPDEEPSVDDCPLVGARRMDDLPGGSGLSPSAVGRVRCR